MTAGIAYQVPWRRTVPDFLAETRPGQFALVVVDMQYFDAHPDYGQISELRRAGKGSTTAYYESRLALIVPNIQRLAKASREAGGRIVFTRIQGLQRDGADRSYYHKYLGRLVPPGSREGEVLEELIDPANDIVISKTHGGSFYGTSLEDVLRNMGCTHLLIAGVITEGCLETTVREAADRGFANVLVEDATGSWDEQAHLAAISAMGSRHCVVRSTNEVVAQLQSVGSDDSAVVVNNCADCN